MKKTYVKQPIYLFDTMKEDYVMLEPHSRGMATLITYEHRKGKFGDREVFEVGRLVELNKIDLNKRYKKIEKKKWWRMRDKIDGYN